MVDVRETSAPKEGKPIHWRLLTTHTVTELSQARRIVDLYRMRWAIEEYFHTLKTAGFDIEAADIGDPQVMIKFVTAASVAAVTVRLAVATVSGRLPSPPKLIVTSSKSLAEPALGSTQSITPVTKPYSP